MSLNFPSQGRTSSEAKTPQLSYPRVSDLHLVRALQQVAEEEYQQRLQTHHRHNNFQNLWKKEIQQRRRCFQRLHTGHSRASISPQKGTLNDTKRK